MKAGKGFLKSGWMFLFAAGLLVAGLWLLSAKTFAPLPGDAIHAGLNEDMSCLPCHSPDGESPLGEKHPPKEQCLTCHKGETGNS